MTANLLVEGIWRMNGFIGIRCILACPSENDVFPSWMLFLEFGDIVRSAVDDDPVE